jgi:predicted dehydrogenase
MTHHKILGRKLRLGMVGGGAGSSIGDSHRIASRLDDRFELVGGAFDIDPERGRAFARSLGLADDRIYDDYRQMVNAEKARPDRCDLVSIATPNSSHFEIARAFVDSGFNVVCEKPLTTNVGDAEALAKTVTERDVIFAVMYGYTGYPLVRQARAMIAAGEIGAVRVIHTEFAHGGLASAPNQINAAALWRLDPKIQGPSLAVGDVGTHALALATFIVGQRVEEVSADLHRFAPGRALDDNAHVMLRFDGGARGTLWASCVAAGITHCHGIRVFGERGGLEWRQSRPDELFHFPLGGRPQVLERDAPGLYPASTRRSRVGVGHAGGYFEAWANIYSDVADSIAARAVGGRADPLAIQFPTAQDGLHGVKFVEAVVLSSRQNGRWVALNAATG